jgi:hypothetical protein
MCDDLAEVMPTRYVQSGKGTLKQVGERQALYVKETRSIHVFNVTAFLLYQCLEEPLDRSTLVEVLGELGAPDQTTLESDIDAALATLLEHELIRAVE